MTYLKFTLLWALTGSPVAAAAILLVMGGVADWYTVGFVRRFFRFLNNQSRASRLRAELALNPANRKARFDLADILVSQGKYAEAVDLLKPVVAEAPHDHSALFLMGVACLGSGQAEQGELFLSTIEESEPTFHLGEMPLEIGRWRLNRKDFKGAVEALSRYVKSRPSSVQGHFLLGEALDGTGAGEAAKASRALAWREYTTSPGYQQRVERLWAWRANPTRPALYSLVVVALVGVLGFALKNVDLASLARSGEPSTFVNGHFAQPMPANPEEARTLKQGGMHWSDCDIRVYYNVLVSKIPALEARLQAEGKSAEEQARAAFDIRHNARMTCRAMMDSELEVKVLRERDREKYGNPDGPTFEMLVKKDSARGLSPEASYTDIIRSSQHTDESVNRECGIER